MRSLSFKLILAFIVVSITGTALVAVLAVLTTASQFDRYIANQLQSGLVSRLGNYYSANGSWDNFSEVAPQLIIVNPNPPTSERPQTGPLARQGGVVRLLLVDEQRTAVINGLGYTQGDQVALSDWRAGIPITVDGQEVGRIIVPGDFFRRGLVGAEIIFLNRVKNFVILGTLGATAVAVFIGVMLARNLTRPLKELTNATKAVSQGDLAVHVPVRSQDELGELAASFNQMNTELARSRSLRRQMTADIAHDLRTPLSIVLGHAEALSDGILPPSEEAFHVMHDEALRLSRLVDDLRTLSLAEAGELPLVKRSVKPEEILTRAVRAYEPQAAEKGITFSMKLDDALPEVDVDPDRLAQVLDNLLENAMRHTPRGGSVTLGARMAAGAAPRQLRLDVHNSGLGISPDELPFIFERFFRGDVARQRREDGGSGLGLAIVKSIVEAHDGQIWVESEQDSGATFIILLPTN